MINIVLDTNIIVSGLQSNKGASFKILSLVNKDIFKINLSTPLVKEYEYVMKKLDILDNDKRETFLNYICSVGNKHSIFYLWRPFLKDPEDDFILELAVKSSSIIITHNIKDFKNSDKLGIKAITPQEFLLMIGDKI
jgi:putative PIN family toxin of toxin-antitoxin system